MNTDVLDRLAAANPMPDGASKPETIMSATALRDVIDDRRGTMQTQDVDQVITTKPPTPRGRGLAVAAAAFAAVAAVGIGIALIANAGSDAEQDVIDNPTTTIVTPTPEAAPPTTQVPPPTTSVVPPATTVAPPAAEPAVVPDADLAFAQQMANTYNEQDLDGYIGLLDPSVTFLDPITGETITVDAMREDAPRWWALDQRINLEECRALGDRTSCRYQVNDIVSDTIGFTPPTMTATFRIVDGVAVVYTEAWSMATHIAYSEALRDWFDENYPDEPRPFDRGYRDSGRWGGHLFPEDPALIRARLAEFAASLGT